MKKFNLLRKSERKSVGTTLALTVGSPSAHRRYSALKHLTFMLLFLLGSLNVWGATATCTLSSAQIKAGSGGTSYGGASATDGCDNTWNAYAIKNQHSNATSDYHFWQIKKYASNTAYYIQVPTMPGNISSLTVTVSSSSKARDGGGNTATLYFSNSNSTSSAGTGVASGTGTSSVTIDCSSLNLKSGYITASAAVRIWDVEVTYDAGGAVIPVESVELNESSITLTVDETQTLEATVTPDDATNKNVTWESSDEAVATVSNAGLVTAVGAGDATITCKSVADPTKYAECAVHVNPSPYTKSTLIFTAACGGSGTADDAAVWTVTSDGEESNYDGTSGIHYGTNSKSVTFLQLATSDIEGTVARVVVNARDAQAKATISVTVGGDDFTCADPAATNTSSDFSFTGSGSGEIIVRVDRGSSMTKALYVKSIVVYYIAAPQKDPAGLAYDDSDLSNLVKLGDAFTAPTLTNPHSLAVSYESSNTDVAEVASNGALTIKAVGVAEITASFAGDEDYKAGSAQYALYVVAHEGTEADPYTVADARVVIDKVGETGIADKYATGIVSKIVTAFNPTYGNITYDISSDGTTEAAQLRAYRGFDKDGAWFTSEDDVMVGDEVVVKGLLKKFGSTYEFDAGNQLVSLNRSKAAAGLEYAETAIEKNIGDATFTNTLTNPNSLDVTYSSTITSVATVDENGEVTIVGMGTTTIKATFAGNASYLADEVSYTLTVEDPSLTKVTFDATIDKGESPLSKSNISLSCSYGVLDNESEYRLYKNSTTTFACSVGNIAMIEFIGVSGNPASGFADPSEGNFVTDGNNATWTGNAASVSFVASGAQVRATKIFVSYREDTRAEAGLAYAETAIAKTIGDDAFVNALTNPNSVAVTYESSDTDVAEVANDGTITIKAQGTTTITASFEGNATYKPASVSYVLTVNEPGLDNVTFDATIDYTADASTLTLSKGGFTLTFTNGALNNKENYRLYKDQTMTLSSSDYLIKKIEFTCTTDNPISGFADATGLDKANNRWTGEANKVELTASNKQVRIEQMIVYYVEDTRAASGLAWSTDEVEITLGDDFSAASLVNPNNIDAAEITVESSNTDLATVTAGVVELVADATGTATITATFAGNATYKPAEFSYTITVNDPTPMIITNPMTYLNFGTVAKDASVEDKTIAVTLTNVASVTATLGGANPEAFSISPASLTESGEITISFIGSTAAVASFAATLTISDGTEGAEDKTVSLSLSVEDAETPVLTTSKWVAATTADLVDGAEVLITGVKSEVTYAMSTQANNNRTTAAGTLAEGVFTPGNNTMSFTLVEQASGKFALRTSNGKYLYAASSTANQLKTRDAIGEDGKAVWTISIAGNVASIVANCETENWRNTMRFNLNNTNPPIFACYASATQNDITLYVPQPASTKEVIRGELSNGKWGTICPKQNVEEVEGATFYQISYLEEQEGMPYNVVFDAISGTTLTAGQPYFFIAEGTEIRGIKSGDAVTSGSSVNGFYGWISPTDASMELTTWHTHYDAGADNTYVIYSNSVLRINQGGTMLKSERCYININSTEPSRSSISPMPGRNRIRMSVQNEQVATGVGEVQGDEVQSTKVIIDGHLYILRGEKMYNATGRLVK